MKRFYGDGIAKLQGDFLAVARERYVEIWGQSSDFDFPELVDAFDLSQRITSITSSPDRVRVFVGTDYGHIFVLPVNSDGRIDKENAQKFLFRQDECVKSLAVSNSGLIAAVGEFIGLKIWDTGLSLLVHVPGSFESVGFSMDKVVFGGDDGLFVMPLSSHEPIKVASGWTRFDTFLPGGYIVATQRYKTLVFADNDSLVVDRYYAYIASDVDGKLIAINKSRLEVFDSIEDFKSNNSNYLLSDVWRSNDIPTGIVLSAFKINISFI